MKRSEVNVIIDKAKKFFVTQNFMLPEWAHWSPDNRKLSPEDRLAAPIKAAISLNKPYDLIYNTLLAAINFRATNENGDCFPSDVTFFSESLFGINHILRNICKLDLQV